MPDAMSGPSSRAKRAPSSRHSLRISWSILEELYLQRWCREHRARTYRYSRSSVPHTHPLDPIPYGSPSSRLLARFRSSLLEGCRCVALMPDDLAKRSRAGEADCVLRLFVGDNGLGGMRGEVEDGEEDRRRSALYNADNPTRSDISVPISTALYMHSLLPFHWCS
jgi:hypothetical protein